VDSNGRGAPACARLSEYTLWKTIGIAVPGGGAIARRIYRKTGPNRPYRY
jgi:hypothetical protein